MIKLNSHSVIIFLLKSIVNLIAMFFIFIVLFVFGFLFYLSSHELHLSSHPTINVLTKIINLKNRDIKLSFSSLHFRQSSLKDMRFDVVINNFSIIQKKTKLQIVNIGDVEVLFSPKEAISGQFIPKINAISNKTINIPLNIINNNKAKKHFSQTNDVFMLNNFDKMVKEISIATRSVLENTRLLLFNGVHITNTSINFIDSEKKSINSVGISDINLKTENLNEVMKTRNQDFDDILNDFNNDNSDYTKLSWRQKIFRRILNLKNNSIETVTTYKINMKVYGKQISLHGLCGYNKLGDVSSCLVNIKNFPLKLLTDTDIIKYTQAKMVLRKTSMDGVVKVFFDNNGIKEIKLRGELKQFQDGDIKITHKTISRISFSFNLLNNFTKIKTATIKLYDNMNNNISSIKTKNATFSNGLLINSNVYFTVNNIKISEFSVFMNENFFKKYTADSLYIDGIIDGTLCFSFNSNGKLVKNNNFKTQSSIKLMNLIINSKSLSVDLSNLVLSLEILKNVVVLRCKMADKNSGEVIFQYDYADNNGIRAIFNHAKLTKSGFNKFKKIFLDLSQFNIMKNIELSLLVNGQMFIPFSRTTFSKDSLFDLTFNVLSSDDEVDDEMLVKVNKKSNSKKGNIEIDFGKSIMYSHMFAFSKQENDISIISGTFEFIDRKQIGLKVNTFWKLNDVEMSSFKFSFIDGIVYALLKSKISQLEVVQKGRKYKVGLSGSSVYVDYEFWHVILLLISFLKDYDLMQVYLDVDDGAIQDVKLDDVRFLINIVPPFFYGHFDFNMHYQGKDYNGMHFVNDKDGTYQIKIPNIIPMLTLYDIDITKFPFYKLSLSGEGKSDIENKILDGYLGINFDSKDSGMFGFMKLYSLNLPFFHYDTNGLVLKKGEFKARWFNVKDIDIGLLFRQKKSHITANLKALVPLMSTKYVPVEMTGDTFEDLFSKVNIKNQSFTLDKNLQISELIKVII